MTKATAATKNKRQKRRDEIARAAIGPLSTLGVRNVSLTELGRDLGMTGAHLLYYFESKNDLFLSALRVVESDLRAHVVSAFDETPSARERWTWLLGVGAPTGLDDSGLLMWLEAWASAVHDAEVHSVITELEEQWQELLSTTLGYAIDRQELPADTDVALVVEGVSALLDGLTIRVVVGYRPVDRALALRIVDAFTSPLLRWQEPPA